MWWSNVTKNSRTIKWILGCLLIGVASFFVGDSFGQRAMLRAFSPEYARQYNGVQAVLAFNRLGDERHWEYLLENGCIAQAKKAIDVAQDKDTELLAEFYRGSLDQSTLKYIRDRDPTLESRLKTFKSKYGNSWTEDACKH